jgi:hypothetical protein
MGRIRSITLSLSFTVCLLAVAPSQAAAPNAVVDRLDAQVDALTQELEPLRSEVAARSEKEQGAVARRVRVQTIVDGADTLLPRLPIVSATVAPQLFGSKGIFADVLADAQHDETATQRQLDQATDRAAAVQGDLLDATRRRDAFKSALEGARDNPDLLEIDEASWSFGGENTKPVSASDINDYLASKASPMAGEGQSFVDAGVAARIDPRLLVAIAGAESAFGIVTCAPNNGWGWGCPSHPFRFRSWKEGIHTVAMGLRENYVDDGLTSVGEIHLRYAPPGAGNDPNGLNYAWSDNVARFLIEQGGNPQNIEGSGPGGKPVAAAGSR